MTHTYTLADLDQLGAVFHSDESHPCLYRVQIAQTDTCAICDEPCWNASIALEACSGTIKAIPLDENGFEFYHRCDLHTVG